MKIWLWTAAAACVLAAGAGTARADTPTLVGDVGLGDAFSISLKDASGASVKHLDPGTYTLVVHDHSALHNFHLEGPGGVDVQTTPEFIGDHTFTIALGDGQFFFQCDPHNAQMKGSFTVGAVATPAPAPAPAPHLLKLAASFTSGTSFKLGPLGSATPGKTLVTVTDKSVKDGFRLTGPGVSKTTSAGYRGTVKWTVALRAGTYRYGSAKNPKQRKSFVVSG
jgi:hypothetical protein